MRPTLRRAALAAAVAAAGTLCPPSGAGAQEAEPAVHDVRAALETLDARTSFYARHLPTGREMGVRADRPMNTLSVIKVPVMIAAYRMADAGELDLDARVRVEPDDLRRGSGLLQTFQPGVEPTWRDLLTQMIVTSDNTATDLVVERVGVERVNRLLADLGYRETRLRRTTGDLFRALWAEGDPAAARWSHREVFERGFPSGEGSGDLSFDFEGDSTEWLGRTTAREMADLVARLHSGELASPESTREMLDIMRRQFYRELLPATVQARGVTVGNKTGGWGPVGLNDAAFFEYEGGPAVAAVFVNQHRGTSARAEAVLSAVGEEVVEAWGGGAGRTADPDLLADLDSIARAALHRDTLPGLSVAVYRGGEPLLVRGWGFADLENDVPAGPETVYRVGSITKQFTAAALMKLVEEGRVGLDDPVSRHVDGLPAWGDEVTIHQLLNHTSGIRSYTSLGPKWQEIWSLDRTHEQMVELFAHEPPDFAPGEGWLYNNSGYYLLGMVVEAATGGSYADYLEAAVYPAAHLDGTVYCGERELIEDRAEGYDRVDGEFVNDLPLSMTQPYAAGSLCSTVEDLARWARALHRGEVVSPGSYRRMTTPTALPGGREQSYGYGLFMGALGEHEVISHGGGIHGFISQLAYYPGEDVAIAVLSNSGSAPSGRIERDLARRILGVVAPEVKDVALTRAERAVYEGTYDLGVGTIRVVDEGEGGVWLRGDIESRLLYQGGHVFVPATAPDDRLVFEVEDGRAVRVRFSVEGMELEGERIP